VLGKRVRVRSARMLSLRRRHLAAIDYEVTLLDRDAEVSIRSELVYRSAQAEGQSADPRKAPLFAHRVLTAERIGADGTGSVQCFRTQLSNLLDRLRH
jgi:alpha,alpha-trehalose phosphorylase